MKHGTLQLLVPFVLQVGCFLACANLANKLAAAVGNTFGHFGEGGPSSFLFFFCLLLLFFLEFFLLVFFFSVDFLLPSAGVWIVLSGDFSFDDEDDEDDDDDESDESDESDDNDDDEDSFLFFFDR